MTAATFADVEKRAVERTQMILVVVDVATVRHRLVDDAKCLGKHLPVDDEGPPAVDADEFSSTSWGRSRFQLRSASLTLRDPTDRLIDGTLKQIAGTMPRIEQIWDHLGVSNIPQGSSCVPLENWIWTTKGFEQYPEIAAPGMRTHDSRMDRLGEKAQRARYLQPKDKQERRTKNRSDPSPPS